MVLPQVSLTDAVAASRKPQATASASCTKCSAALSMAVTPHLVHDRSNVLAHVAPEGCSPVDLLPCTFGAQCGSCGAAAALRDMQVRSIQRTLQRAQRALPRYEASTCVTCQC